MPKTEVDRPTANRLSINVSTLLKKKSRGGKEYLVGPVILARVGVMNGLLYPAEELRKYPSAWNDRVVPVFHPEDGKGTPVSANSQDIIDAHTVGRLYNTAFSEDLMALRSEIWLEPDRVKTVSPRLCEILAGNGQVDVSTGLFIDTEVKEGVYKGKKYTGIARNYRPDHLALLPDKAGACSWADGAGFPRVNEQDDELTDNELSFDDRRRLINSALSAMYPAQKTGNGNSLSGRPYVEELFDDHVVYSVGDGVSAVKFFDLSYTISKDEKNVKFEGNPTQVVRKTVFEPVTANDEGETSTSVNSGAPAGGADQSKSKQGGQGMVDKTRKERIDALVANGRVDGNGVAHLEAMTDEQFDWIEESLTANEEETQEAAGEEKKTAPAQSKIEKKVEDKPTANAEQKPSEEDWHRFGKKLYEDEKAKHIATITANKRNAFTADELKGMTFDQLGKLASIAKQADYSGRDSDNGRYLAANMQDTEALMPPTFAVPPSTEGK